VIVLRVTLVDGTYHDIEVPLDSAEDAMDALRNSHSRMPSRHRR
jgi:hypothetical protein